MSKGSKRRPEDNDRYRARHEQVFGDRANKIKSTLADTISGQPIGSTMNIPVGIATERTAQWIRSGSK